MSSASRRETLENSRTRRPSGVAAVANFARYGDEVVRERVSIKWDGGDWYLGTVRQWSATSEEHLIAYDDVHSDDPTLLLPHPRAAERDFVLRPWLAVDPDAVLPGRGRVDALLAALDDGGPA